jgi:hypothetical protein
MGYPPIPQLNTTCDIWTGSALFVPQVVRHGAVLCQILSAFGSGGRGNRYITQIDSSYTHVVLFAGGTDVHDDWRDPVTSNVANVADWIAYPSGGSPILIVRFVERRDIGMVSEYMRVYCMRASLLTGVVTV